MPRAERAAFALGSNLGDRRAHLDHAVRRLSDFLQDPVVSSFIETEPVGVGPQPLFLNGAVVGLTSLAPHDLLERLLGIEQQQGRDRPFPGAPRTLDLDLLLLGSHVVCDDRLILPHPRFRERLFVLAPLVEIAPGLVDPVTGLTIRDLYDRLARHGDRPV
jgi:2-amino-4-hydroxy-6-hydroxymethyldihydropteridine diphosphokinase